MILGEFQGEVQAMLESKNISFGNLQSSIHKAQTAEYSIHKLGKAISQFLKSRETKRYIDHLNEILKGLNGTFIETLGMTPAEVSPTNQNEVWMNRVAPLLLHHPEKKPIYSKGDLVRLRIKKLHAFSKSYAQRFSDQIFKIKSVIPSPGFAYLYKLETLENDEILGRYYANDLSQWHGN